MGDETELSEIELGVKWGDLCGKIRAFVEELEQRYEFLVAFERGRELEVGFRNGGLGFLILAGFKLKVAMA